MTLRFDDAARARARTFYETTEPLHVLAYFNSGLDAAMADTGLDGYAWYVGARGAPLGDCTGPVVSSTFFNFNPDVVHPAWDRAKAVGLHKVSDRRFQMLDEMLRVALGERIESPQLPELVQTVYAIAADLPMPGRPLAAAWAHSPRPDGLHLQLWHALAIVREWRGDGHVAALTAAGLGRVEALVFHEATHPNPDLRKRGLGRRISQFSRGWSDSDWETAQSALVQRGLLVVTEDTDQLTAAGGLLYDELEMITDDAAAAPWATFDGFDHLIATVRPFVKGVIDSGMLPGTRKK
ncbi:hypothetical protein [Williamsia sp. CHRR-6]|uniref:SCO6745 family protein n=1 Tax=Williamsia sp. CHRR-6 TaxID=2835871 RepID=UPI001BD96EDB|nr:hypothetical protein [Williamsia sp. CHRR-6]MBT0566225.1 hypothetical protein [Williamsia sp. CHRR-6]